MKSSVSHVLKRTTTFTASPRPRTFRSDASLDAIAKASQDRVPALALYNYPSFSGSFSALFAHLFHSRLNLPCLILPFSSVHPLRVEDLCTEGLEKLYLLDFLGPKGFAEEISRRASTCKVIGFDHRKSVLRNVPSMEDCPENLAFHVNVEKSSSTAVYDYFSAKIAEARCSGEMVESLLEPKDRDRAELLLKYIEDVDLRQQNLPDIGAFTIGLDEWRSKLNCLTNPYMYEQLLEINVADLIAKGNYYISVREKAAKKLLDKVFKVRLGRGFYGECLGVRADGNSDLVNEIGKQLSLRSAAAGLRPIGAVIYKQRNNLKMCLRSTDSGMDTSEVAKAYGGGGSSNSSSFIIRMDEYNQWLSVNRQDHLKEMSRKASGESYVWDQAKEKLFIEKLDDYLASTGGKQPSSSILELWANEFNTRFGGVPAFGSTLYTKKERMRKIYRGWKVLKTHTGLGYDPNTDTVVCSDETWHSFIKDNKECTHLRYEGLRNKDFYFNIFEKNHAAGASGFGSVTMGGGSTPSYEFDFSMDQSGTHPVLEEAINPSIGPRRQVNTRGMNEECGASRSRGSTGKRKQRDATDEMTFSAMQEIVNHFRGRSQLATSSNQNSRKDHILDCMNIMKEMGIPQYQRTIMWHYFDAHQRLQRPFCLLDDDDRRGIIDSVVASQMPSPS